MINIIWLLVSFPGRSQQLFFCCRIRNMFLQAVLRQDIGKEFLKGQSREIVEPTLIQNTIDLTNL